MSTPPQGNSMDLLQGLIDRPLDDDYYEHPPHPRTSKGHAATLAILALFALILTVAAVQTKQDQPNDARERAALIAQINEQKTYVARQKRAVDTLGNEVSELERTAAATKGSAARARLRATTGAAAVHGPGVVVTVDNGPEGDSKPAARIQDRDLQGLANSLWLAGAEAISINGNRLTSLSSIRTAGEAITVGYKSLERPYVLSAIGSPDSLESRFTHTAYARSMAKLHDSLGIRFSVRDDSSMHLPAAARRQLKLREAKVLGTGS